MIHSQKFLSLDLEFNQPSQKIIQVGITIGSLTESEDKWIKEKWYVDPGEPISDYIIKLTGITQSDISRYAVSYQTIATDLINLINKHNCFVNPVTWGGGDCESLLHAFRSNSVDFPKFGRRWIDVKTIITFDQITKGKAICGGLSSALGSVKLHFKGNPHQADDDAFNTLRLLSALVKNHSLSIEAIRVAKQCLN